MSKPERKLIGIRFTLSEAEAEMEAIERSGLTPTEFRRNALATLMESYGVEFPNDMPTVGTTTPRNEIIEKSN